jgi:hypothetical protein
MSRVYHVHSLSSPGFLVPRVCCVQGPGFVTVPVYLLLPNFCNARLGGGA